MSHHEATDLFYLAVFCFIMSCTVFMVAVFMAVREAWKFKKQNSDTPFTPTKAPGDASTTPVETFHRALHNDLPNILNNKA